MSDEQECDGCGSTTVPLKAYTKAWPLHSTETKLLCGLCDSTRVGQEEHIDGRALSIAVTNLETAMLWVANARL